jgi:CubicO group peptidase (beta-lactamase class C family)
MHARGRRPLTPARLGAVLRGVLSLAAAVSTPLASARADDLDRAIEAEMARQQVPGLTLAVVRQERIVRVGAYGYGDLEWRARATPDTRFEIASVSKMFTGAAARILVEEGRLDPETPIRRYFEGLPDSWAGIKVRHLLTMSTGLPEDWGGDLIPYEADVITTYDDASMVRAFTTLKMAAPVGTEFHYSSPGYAMLGMIVSKCAGAALPDFVAKRVFEPAGMVRSSFIDNAAVVPERAQGYRKAGDGIVKGWYLGQYLHARPDVGILSTAPDLARWVIALGGDRILKEPGRLWEGAVADSGRALDYSYGWFVGTQLGHRLVGHGGRYRTGFRSVIDTYPDDDLSVVVLTNGDWPNVARFAALAARAYIPALPSPDAERRKTDIDFDVTAAAITALSALAQGRIDPELMNADALEPLTLPEASGFLKEVAAFDSAGHGRPPRPLAMHGHPLVDYTTVALRTKSDVRFVTLYRDDRGRFAYVELSE